jgi:uncharacterized ferritin-like protein (DUF455 family)
MSISNDRIRVKEGAARLAKYRYLEIQIVELMGGWVESVPEPDVKISFGRQMYQDIVHADVIGKRLPELKARQERYHATAPSDEFVKLLEEIWNAQSTLPRLAALYRVLKPGLVDALTQHLSLIALPEDEPTERILKSIIEADGDDIGWGEGVIDKLLNDNPGEKVKIREWEMHLKELWKTSGGLIAEGREPGTYTFRKEFKYSTQPARDDRWTIISDAGSYSEKNWLFDSNEGKLHLLHDLLNSEFITVERTGRILAEFPDLPWAMRMDMARQSWDEARHAEIIQRRLEELGGYVGMYPVNFWGWEVDVNRPDPLERLALSNMTFERESSKHVRDWIAKAKKSGDTASVRVLEYILADEVTHVQYGLHWVDELTKNDPERRRRVLEYPKRLLEDQHPVGVRFDETINKKKN